MVPEASNETIRSYVFKTNYWCVFVGKQWQESIMKEKETTLSQEGYQDQDHFQLSYVDLERQEQELIITVSNTNMAHEDDIEEGVEEQHLDTMLMDYEEELRLLEEWIERPKEGEYCITVADKKYPRIPSCNIIIKEVRSQDIGLSCDDGILLHT
jgi:hypothetical protein